MSMLFHIVKKVGEAGDESDEEKHKMTKQIAQETKTKRKNLFKAKLAGLT
jgi:Trm5-related predicted tRNA methylase